jgi:hypothetical protein
MFDCTFFQDLKADGIKKEIVESIQERIFHREDEVHAQAESLGVFLSPTTMNR